MSRGHFGNLSGRMPMGRFGKMPTTSALRLISLFSLSWGLSFIDDKDDAMVCLYYSPLLHHSKGHYRQIIDKS